VLAKGKAANLGVGTIGDAILSLRAEVAAVRKELDEIKKKVG
jgi:hypothetical protein